MTGRVGSVESNGQIGDCVGLGTVACDGCVEELTKGDELVDVR